MEEEDDWVGIVFEGGRKQGQGWRRDAKQDKISSRQQSFSIHKLCLLTISQKKKKKKMASKRIKRANPKSHVYRFID